MLRQLPKTNFSDLSKNIVESPDSSLNSLTDDIAIPNQKIQKPKRNRSAFIIFSSEMRPVLKAEEKVNSNEMMVKLAELWKNLKKEDRKKYEDIAEKEKIKYLVEVNNFYQNHPYEVIQNKTKTNHIKKPCSAYGLFLKETKQIVKSEHPELKMADILKIVAERWKKLTETQRKIYQDQARLEKEAAKSKLDEHCNNLENPTTLMFLPQKRLQSQKRVKKALMRENLKAKNSTPIDARVEEADTSDSSPFEEAVFAPANPDQNNDIIKNYFASNEDNQLLLDLTSFNFNFNRTPSIEPIFQDLKEIKVENLKPAPQVSTNSETINELKSKKCNDFIADLLNFHSRQETIERTNSLKNSQIISSSYTNMVENSNKTSRQAVNDTLLGVLAYDNSNEFNFDFLRFDASSGEISF